MTDVIRWRPAPAVRKILLLTHIAAGGAWLGLDLALAALVVTAFTAEAAPAAASAVSLAAFATWPLVIVSLVALGTGILLGIGSKYGLVRYRWVLVKLVLTVILATLVTVVLAPGIGGIRALGLEAIGSGTSPAVPTTMLFPPVVSTTAVSFAMAVSVFKPWGRVRRSVPTNRSGAALRSDRSARIG